jgi:hypothetical protein
VSAKSLFARFAPALAWCALLGCRSEVSGWVLAERVTGAPGPDTGPDVRVPEAGCPNCPVSVVWSNPTAIPQRGSPDGVEFDDACPDNQAIIGFHGSLNDVGVFLVSSIQTFCGQPVIASSNPTEVSIVPGETLPERGMNSGQTWTQMCPRDQMVVGFWGRSGLSLDQVGFDCAGIHVSGSPPLLAVDTTISELSPPNGGDGGLPFRSKCMPGQIARTANINADAWVNAFGLTCETPGAVLAASSH